MDRLDEELREALRREEPPDGFTERVLARAAAQPVRPGRWERFAGRFRLPRMRWVAAVAMSLVLISGYAYHREQQRRAEGERAKQQVLLALWITAHEFQIARAKVLELNTAR